jgi:hypothetical protein
VRGESGCKLIELLAPNLTAAPSVGSAADQNTRIGQGHTPIAHAVTGMVADKLDYSLAGALNVADATWDESVTSGSEYTACIASTSLRRRGQSVNRWVRMGKPPGGMMQDRYP